MVVRQGREDAAGPAGSVLVGNGLDRAQVDDIQRGRMLAAMVEVTAEHGAGNVTVGHVVERSGVSRRTFYEIFEDREECFLAAFEESLAWVASEVLPAYEGSAPWRQKIRNGLIALLRALDGDPGITRLLIVESLAGGPVALERRRRVLNELVVAIDEGRAEVKATYEPTSMTAEGLVGGVLAVIHARLLESDSEGKPDSERLIDLANPLMSMIVLPYLGPSAARRELERLIPRVAPGAHAKIRDPLRDLGMRLTYRTVRVLVAIGAHPGASNREIAESAGVEDQGQISKLLTRLQKLGLILNTGAGHARGAPNAWTLTDQGTEVQDAITTQTTH